MEKQLSIKTLDQLSRDVAVPDYDLRKSQCGIVHIGPGAFHRAHQAYYTDLALAYGGNWRIHGVSMRSDTLKKALAPQDNLYSLAVVDNTPSLRVLGAIKTLSTLSEDRDVITAALCSPAIKIISLTVTEKGYCLNNTGSLDVENPDIQHDLANPDLPISAVGLIAQALKAREHSGDADVTIISCDNVTDNGKKLAKAVIDFAYYLSPELAKWIQNNIAFPCTMVDSITPATDDEVKSNVSANLGLKDDWPIQRETFTQWVIEDHFSGPRPPWEKVGVTFTKDVTFFEKAKLRILNGTHSTLAYVGLLFGKETVYDAISTPSIQVLISALLEREIIPSIETDYIETLRQYAADIIARYHNKHIRHMLSQIAWDGSQKLPFRILDTVRDNLHANRDINLLCIPIAAWCLFVSRKAKAGESITDPKATALIERATRHAFDPVAVTNDLLNETTIFAELSANSLFRDHVLTQVKTLSAWSTQDVDETLDPILEDL
ncbi:mannitol dehydrogenase family protein [Alteromonas stellipolaris]|uniref:mannitol dehydrogenase family protein n=1 Tax=Alteromonas stellipolaris TaxID=233316 RepID=UPI002494D16B|nr:mannitol dehydrogenase family protein [Alteromonas stellipolaris]MDO6534526.1 mannitol dehydrogenase family protein [Alteromonas stellipolaris]MDO6626403.1 mannitol dehydrogenase family protein [Alteromonas stellipolaris]